jgi:hypothetical protein
MATRRGRASAPAVRGMGGDRVRQCSREGSPGWQAADRVSWNDFGKRLTPLKPILPPSGCESPAIHRAIVVLPLPLSPSRPSVDPSSRVKSTPHRISLRRPPAPLCALAEKVRPSISNKGIGPVSHSREVLTAVHAERSPAALWCSAQKICIPKQNAPGSGSPPLVKAFRRWFVLLPVHLQPRPANTGGTGARRIVHSGPLQRSSLRTTQKSRHRIFLQS